MDKFCGLFNFTDSLLELAHSQTFFFRPYSLVWHDLRALLITPASNTIAFTTAKLNSRFINHEFNQAKIEYPMITTTFFSTPHPLRYRKHKILLDSFIGLSKKYLNYYSSN
jgi:hypothetical protein